MKDQKKNTLVSPVPVSWVLSKEELETSWEDKAKQFKQFKEYFGTLDLKEHNCQPPYEK